MNLKIVLPGLFLRPDIEIRIIINRFLLSALAKFRKPTIKIRHVCLSVRIEQLGSHRTDFHEIWYFMKFDICEFFEIRPENSSSIKICQE